MAARNSDRSKTTYYSVIGGKFATKTTEQDPEAVKRENTNGAIVFERHYEILDGFLRGVVEKTATFNGRETPMVELVLVDNYGVVSNLSFQRDSSILNRLLMRFPLVEFNKLLELEAYEYTKDGKTKTYVDIIQNGTKVPAAYTKDNMRDCPEWNQVNLRGKLVWDNFDQVSFLLNKLKEELSKIEVGQTPKPQEKPVIAYKEESDAINSAVTEDDDLPF